jgi:ribosomal protein S18 acetylase RimI-like enzyme
MRQTQGVPATLGRMTDLRLRPATEAEYDAWRTRLIPNYAAEKVAAGHWTAEEAPGLAARQTDGLLPRGTKTPGMLVLAAETPDGELMGMVWVALDRDRPGAAWIYYIEVLPGQRGKGYGRALLRAAEQYSARHGATEMGLNVFGPNAVARSLYESSGYEITAVNMRKRLPSQDG